MEEGLLACAKSFAVETNQCFNEHKPPIVMREDIDLEPGR